MIVKSSPVLQSVARTGATKYWQCHIVQENDHWFTQTSWWQELAGGGLSTTQFSAPYECKVKNAGKKNEVTPEAQASSEFNAIVKKQMDKGYHELGKTTKTALLPMLAQKFKERKHKITYPCYVQPKYNGMRDIYDGEASWSRGGKQIIPEVVAHLQFNTRGLALDGELILPGNPKLQVTMRAAKKYRPQISEQLLYIVYDAVIVDQPFSERLDFLEHLFKDCLFDGGNKIPKNVILSETYIANSEAEVMRYHKQFVSEGYEGTIIRNADGMYTPGQRSIDLQKYKDMMDSEFQIVGIKDGEGSYKGCACFICITPEGRTFDCNPEGTLEHKRELLEEGEANVNRWLTIRYQELSEDGIPLFPVGVDIRDPELSNED